MAMVLHSSSSAPGTMAVPMPMPQYPTNPTVPPGLRVELEKGIASEQAYGNLRNTLITETAGEPTEINNRLFDGYMYKPGDTVEGTALLDWPSDGQPIVGMIEVQLYMEYVGWRYEKGQRPDASPQRIAERELLMSSIDENMQTFYEPKRIPFTLKLPKDAPGTLTYVPKGRKRGVSIGFYIQCVLIDQNRLEISKSQRGYILIQRTLPDNKKVKNYCSRLQKAVYGRKMIVAAEIVRVPFRDEIEIRLSCDNRTIYKIKRLECSLYQTSKFIFRGSTWTKYRTKVAEFTINESFPAQTNGFLKKNVWLRPSRVLEPSVMSGDPCRHHVKISYQMKITFKVAVGRLTEVDPSIVLEVLIGPTTPWWDKAQEYFAQEIVRVIQPTVIPMAITYNPVVNAANQLMVMMKRGIPLPTCTNTPLAQPSRPLPALQWHQEAPPVLPVPDLQNAWLTAYWEQYWASMYGHGGPEYQAQPQLALPAPDDSANHTGNGPIVEMPESVYGGSLAYGTHEQAQGAVIYGTHDPVYGTHDPVYGAYDATYNTPGQPNIYGTHAQTMGLGSIAEGDTELQDEETYGFHWFTEDPAAKVYSGGNTYGTTADYNGLVPGHTSVSGASVKAASVAGDAIPMYPAPIPMMYQ